MTGAVGSRWTERWWETSSGVTRAMLKQEGRTLTDLIDDLDRLAGLGFDAIEVFAPTAGGTTYAGLDVLDFDAVDPAIGTGADFERLVDQAHRRGMAVIAFLNLGYCNEDYPPFRDGSAALGSGRPDARTRWFRWSRNGGPPPLSRYAPYFQDGAIGSWQWEPTAESSYWVRWRGEDEDKSLPQFDFADPGWQREARRVVERWVATGIDGIVFDAVNWYLGCDWRIARQVLVGGFEHLMLHPEGAGGFGDDPVPWISAGGFNVVMDYSLMLWWEGVDVVADAVQHRDATMIERALRQFRDPVVAAGGVTYVAPGNLEDGPPSARLLRLVTIATVGQLVLDLDGGAASLTAAEREAYSQVLDARRRHPALCATGSRVLVPTPHPGIYAFLRRHPLEPQRSVLVVLNFTDQPAALEVEVHGVVAVHDTLTGVRVPHAPLCVDVDGHGFRLCTVEHRPVQVGDGAR